MSSDGGGILQTAGNTFNQVAEGYDKTLGLGVGKELKKQLFPSPTSIDPTASAVTRISQAEKNIEGAASSGALDSQTAQDLRGQLAGQGNSYDYSTGQIGSIQSRLDSIASGTDPTVNDRLRLQNTLLNLKDRPGRSGLIGG